MAPIRLASTENKVKHLFRVTQFGIICFIITLSIAIYDFVWLIANYDESIKSDQNIWDSNSDVFTSMFIKRPTTVIDMLVWLYFLITDTPLKSHKKNIIAQYQQKQQQIKKNQIMVQECQTDKADFGASNPTI